MKTDYISFKQKYLSSGTHLVLTLNLILALSFLAGCDTVPLYHGKPISARPPAVHEGESAVLFSCIVQKAALSKSQGTEWLVGQSDEEARKIHDSLEGMLSEELKLSVIPAERVINLRLYTDGMFPMRIPYYRNPLLLPVITNEREEEMMLRTKRALQTEYFITASATYGISKYVFLPAKVTARIQWNLYTEYGPVYSTMVETEERASPYAFSFLPSRTMDLYRQTMQEALDRAFAHALEELRGRLRQDLPENKILVIPAR